MIYIYDIYDIYIIYPNCCCVYKIPFFCNLSRLVGQAQLLQYHHSYHNNWLIVSSYTAAHVMPSNFGASPSDASKNNVPIQIVPLCCMFRGDYSFDIDGWTMVRALYCGERSITN